MGGLQRMPSRASRGAESEQAQCGWAQREPGIPWAAKERRCAAAADDDDLGRARVGAHAVLPVALRCCAALFLLLLLCR